MLIGSASMIDAVFVHIYYIKIANFTSLRFTRVFQLKQHMDAEHGTTIREKIGYQGRAKIFIQYKSLFD